MYNNLKKLLGIYFWIIYNRSPLMYRIRIYEYTYKLPFFYEYVWFNSVIFKTNSTILLCVLSMIGYKWEKKSRKQLKTGLMGATITIIQAKRHCISFLISNQDTRIENEFPHQCQLRPFVSYARIMMVFLCTQAIATVKIQ